MTVDHVWLAWTENPRTIRWRRRSSKRRTISGAALTEAARALHVDVTRRPRRSRNGEAVASLLGFFDRRMPLGAGKFAPTVDEAMDFVRTGRAARPAISNSGRRADRGDWLPGFRIFVLGPPRRRGSALPASANTAARSCTPWPTRFGARRLLCAVGQAWPRRLRADGKRGRRLTASVPFDVRFRHDAATDETKRLFQDTYFAEDASWRRIDRTGCTSRPIWRSSSTARPTTPASCWRSSASPTARCCSSLPTRRKATGCRGTTTRSNGM